MADLWIRRLYRTAIHTIGVPPFPRGNVLVLPYRHLADVHRRLQRESGLVSLHDPLVLPPLPP